MDVGHVPTVVVDGSHGKEDVAVVASLDAGGVDHDEMAFVVGLKNLVWYSHLSSCLALPSCLEARFVFSDAGKADYLTNGCIDVGDCWISNFHHVYQ